METSGLSVTVAYPATSREEWFDPMKPLKLLPYFPSIEANKFRRRHIKGFVTIQGCHYYIGLSHNYKLIGLLGFFNPDYGNHDIFLKADTTPQSYSYSTDLLLYVLKKKK